MTDAPGIAQSPQVEPAPAAPPAPATPAFRAVFDAELQYVWNVLRRMGVRAGDLEDLTNEVFVAVHRGLATFDATRPMRPWLFGIAFRVASNHRRQARHRYEVADDAAAAVDPADGPEEHLASGQARQLVLDALEALDLDLRGVLVMHDLDGHPVPEVAAALGLPLNTAYSRLRLARERFAAAVRRLQLRRGER